MDINIDSAIFIGFLIANLGLGLWSSRGIKGIKEYAIGNRNFSTATIAATIIATWIFGSSFAFNLSETYSQGLYFIIPALADGISFFIVAYFYAPRIAEFFEKISVADVMGDLYGKHVKIITAVSSIIPAIGNISLQFMVLTALLHYFLGISSTYALVSSSVIIITYSTFGGIKAVTFTDMIQFFTFGIVIPMSAFLIWNSLQDNSKIYNVLATNELFDINAVLSFNNPKCFDTIMLFLFFLIPGLDPAFFQRLLMSKSTGQVSKSCYISGIIIILIYLTLDLSGLLLLANDAPPIDQSNMINYVLQNYIPTGLKGFFVIGIMAMLMSTADSYINTSSVLFVHDFCKPMGINLSTKNELMATRIVACLIGFLALVLSLFTSNFLDLILSLYSFYMPIVSTPLILAIFGFRSQSKAVLIGMGAGFITVLCLKIFYPDVNNIILGMLANMIFLFGSHYLLKQKGGWIGIKDNVPLESIRQVRKAKINSFLSSLKVFNVIAFCKDNAPRNENVYVYFGLLSIISIFSAAFSIPKDIYHNYADLITPLLYSVLTISTIFITYPIWLDKFKSEAFISVLWNIAMVYCVAFANSWLFMISGFHPMLLTILTVNLITVAILLRWQIALLIMVVGIVCSVEFYKYLNNLYRLSDDMFNQFKIVYSLAVASSILIAFLKPKQEYQELTEEQNNHLQVMIKDREEELGKAQALKHEFLRNLEHEVNTPLVGLTSLAPMVLEDFDRLSPKQMKKYVKSIVDSHESYKTLSDNLLDLSKLDSMKYKLDKVKLDLSDLIKDRLDYCCRLYLGNKGLEFATEIDSDVIIECDEHYITSLIDNLIINAIKYSKEGKIALKLSKKDASVVEFQIIDEGIGIPKPELHDIFGAFVVSSKTRTPSGGRGIGLALCKKIVEVHGGSIRADSDGERGATFIVELPVSSTSETKGAIVQGGDILPPGR